MDTDAHASNVATDRRTVDLVEVRRFLCTSGSDKGHTYPVLSDIEPRNFI